MQRFFTPAGSWAEADHLLHEEILHQQLSHLPIQLEHNRVEVCKYKPVLEVTFFFALSFLNTMQIEQNVFNAENFHSMYTFFS